MPLVVSVGVVVAVAIGVGVEVGVEVLCQLGGHHVFLEYDVVGDNDGLCAVSE